MPSVPSLRRLSLPRRSALVGAVVAVSLALAGCADILASPATRREAAWMAENPPTGQLIALDGRQVHVQVSGQPRGQGPDVVLLHGSNGNLHDFTFDLVALLEPDFRVIAVDRPGLGYSDSWGPQEGDPAVQARILRRALAQVGLHRPVVVGQSYGGAVAMAWALEAEADTAAVVLVSGATHPWGGELSPWYEFNTSPLAPGVHAAIATFAPVSAGVSAVERVFAPDPVPPGYAEHFAVELSMRRASQANNARQINALHDHLERMQPRYAGLRLPIEILQGSEDRIIDPDTHARPMVAEVPSARLTVLDGAGHMLHHSRTDDVAAAIRRAARRAGVLR